ncbi:MAG: hypothetical protein DMG79_07145 [Acidobacteria bacterium]|nr:MAG: hypothetical protein DMG79_07145 [Acidobacteriota bacterium]
MNAKMLLDVMLRMQESFYGRRVMDCAEERGRGRVLNDGADARSQAARPGCGPGRHERRKN